MSLVINHNLMALHAARNLDNSYSLLGISTRRLSSGLRINSAADDPAGLAIREMMRADISAFNQGMRNANDAVSAVQTADGALSIIDEKLIRMKELAVQAATGTYTSDQRLIIDSEYQSMASEITRIASSTKFNGIYLLNGNLASSEHNGNGLNPVGKLKIHFGVSNSSAEDYYYVQINNCTSSSFGIGNNANNVINQPQNYAYFEKLRDSAATAAYNATYSSEYQTTFNTIYAQRISEGLDPAAARESANTLAAQVAEPRAQADKSSITDSLNNAYDDAYGTAYSSAYTQYLARGYSAAEASRLADGDAAKAGIEASLSESTKFISGNPTEMPLQNVSGAELLMRAASNATFTASYTAVYNDQFPSEYASQLAAQSPPKDPAAAAAAAHSIVHPIAESTASTNGTAVYNDLKQVYDENWVPTYNTTYTSAISAGRSVDEATALATDAANNAGWTAMQNELTSMGSGTATYIPGTYALDDFGGLLTQTQILGSASTGASTWLSNNGVYQPSSITNAGSTFSSEHVYEYHYARDGYSISTQEAAQRALAALDRAIVSKDRIRANLGAIQNRLTNTVTNLSVQVENLVSAESSISDVDVATEMTEYTRQQILTQAGVAMLSQANSLPKMALQLIQG
ncbi:hypothetical protein JCM15519_24370 [Fundidesulfovibrio butyratiphilus]